jgi:hypothetical protein
LGLCGYRQLEKLAREFGTCTFVLMLEKNVGVVQSMVQHAMKPNGEVLQRIENTKQ